MENEHYSAANPRARYLRSALATLILICSLTLFISAGIWQLNRAGEKHDLKATFAVGALVNTLTKLVDDADAAEFRFRLFELHGQYDPQHQILLDNIVADGRNGYQILTPFKTDGQTVLVNRGWVPADVDRSNLPSINFASEPRTIIARLNSLPVPGMHLGNTVDATAPWPRRMLYPTRDEIATALETTVLDYQLLLNADQDDGYLRNWQAVGVGPERHYGYAFQWFSFAALTLIFYVILNFRWNKQHKNNLQTNTAND